jgi:hypothetical protein
MAAVFGGSTKISRAVPDPGTDKSLPSSGSLSWGGITGASAVAGTTGADCKLVNGDRWQQVNGNHTENVSTNVLTTIQGNVTRSVLGNEDFTTAGDVTRTIVGMLNETLVAGQSTSCVGPFNRTDVAPVTWLCPTSSQINSGDLYECKIFKGGAYAIRNVNVAVDTSIRILNEQIHVHQMSVAQFETKVSSIEGFACLTTNKVGAVGNFLGGLRNNMTGMTSKLRAMEAGVGPEVTPPLAIGAPPFD